MKQILLGVMILSQAVLATGQKIMAEGVVQYKITVLSKGEVPGVADAFAGASQVLQLKGYKARLDFTSPLRTQSSIYDAQSGEGFVLRLAGNDKYLIPLNAEQWKRYHKRFDGVKFTNTNEHKLIAGYNTQQAVGKAPDGSQLTVYYATDLSVLAKGYDLAFAGLAGLPLEYEISSAGVVLRYEATEVRMTMVSASTFEVPKSGYKVLEFK